MESPSCKCRFPRETEESEMVASEESEAMVEEEGLGQEGRGRMRS